MIIHHILTLISERGEENHPKVLRFEPWCDFRSHSYFIDADTEAQRDDVIAQGHKAILLVFIPIPGKVTWWTFYSTVPLKWWGVNRRKNNVSSPHPCTKTFLLVIDDKHWERNALCTETGVKRKRETRVGIYAFTTNMVWIARLGDDIIFERVFSNWSD